MREGEYGALLGDPIEGELGIRNEGGGFAAFLEDAIPRIAAFPLRGRCPEGADRADII